MKKTKRIISFLLVFVFALSISTSAYASATTYLLYDWRNNTVGNGVTYLSNTFTPTTDHIQGTFYLYNGLYTETYVVYLQKYESGTWSTYKSYTLTANGNLNYSVPVSAGTKYRMKATCDSKVARQVICWVTE